MWFLMYWVYPPRFTSTWTPSRRISAAASASLRTLMSTNLSTDRLISSLTLDPLPAGLMA